MDPLLKLLHDDATLRPDKLARMLDLTEAEVIQRIRQFEKEGIILGCQTILNEEKLDLDLVRAVIEVKITPEREGGFDRMAERIARYDDVSSCYLMSGGYDLLVIVEGQTLREVATFVAEKLSTLQGVVATATHFMLKPYKEKGIMLHQESTAERLAVSP